MDIGDIDNLNDEQILDFYKDIVETPSIFIVNVYCNCVSYHRMGCYTDNSGSYYYVSYNTSCK